MKRHIRSISMVVAFLVGGLFHKQLAPLGAWLPASVALMLSITFIGIETARLKPQRMHLWVLLGIQLIGMGFWGVARLLGYPVLAESLFFCGIAPVAIAAPVIVNLLRGNTAFITTAMVLSQAVFAIITPIILPHTPTLIRLCFRLPFIALIFSASAITLIASWISNPFSRSAICVATCVLSCFVIVVILLIFHLVHNQIFHLVFYRTSGNSLFLP
jgi:hypothetical protein